MNSQNTSVLPLCAAVLLCWPAVTLAAAPCPLRLSPADLPRCALAASLDLRAQDHAVSAARERKAVAGVVLPSLPQLAVAAGARTAVADSSSAAWSAGLAQEIELGGQRRVRVAAAQAGVEAEEVRGSAVRREVLAAAWSAWYDLLARHGQADLAKQDAAASAAVAVAVRARAERGVAADVDADIAEAAALESERGRLQAEQQAAQARVALATVLGLAVDADVEADGPLAPLPTEASGGGEAPEVLTLRAESRALAARADAVGRNRTPNLTLTALAQHDRSGETAWLFGVGLPIPLPASVARNYAAEAAELRAISQRVGVESELAVRRLGAETAVARAALAARQAELALYTPERLARARQQLTQLAADVAHGRLGVRDALQARQALIGLLRGELAARAGLCQASVELARLTGAIEGSVP